MLVFLKEKLVIFSVPKTGTTALETVLAADADVAIINPPILKHMPVYRFNRFMKPLFDVVGSNDLEYFAMVREPISHLSSWYRYRQRDEVIAENSTKNLSFDEFVLESLKGRPPAYANVGTQSRFVKANTDTVLIDHLFQYEQMHLAISFLEGRLKRKITLDRLNVSPQLPCELQKNTENRLRRKRAEEFEMWDSALV